MKLLTVKNIHFLSVALLLCAVSSTALSQVYKVVDKDGNVTYTDTAPKNGGKPMELQPLSVIEAPDYLTPVSNADDPVEKGKSLRALRSKYKDFAITSPLQDESVFAQEQNVTVVWATKAPLVAGMKVNFSIDGARQPATESNSISVPPLERGEHTVGASLLDANGKVIANAPSVTFFVKQPSIYTNPPPVRPTPNN